MKPLVGLAQLKTQFKSRDSDNAFYLPGKKHTTDPALAKQLDDINVSQLVE